MFDFLRNEPILLSLLGSTGVVTALFSVLDSYEVHFTPKQVLAWTALVTAVGGAIARSQVRPLSKTLTVDLAKVGQP